MVTLPLWLEIIVAALLLASGVLTLAAAWGLVRLKHFFQRMHPPALGFTAASWSAALASAIYFSWVQESLSLRSWIIVVVLSITVPITTVLLARAAMFRRRQQGDARMPPVLVPREEESAAQAPASAPAAKNPETSPASPASPASNSQQPARGR